MDIRSISLLSAAAIALAACGSNEPATQQQPGQEQEGSAAATSQPAGKVHSANGDITEISADSVTVSHGPVESIGWPAMTMAFQASSQEMLQGLNVGDPVDFQFQEAGGQYLLTSIKKAQQ